MRPFSHMDDRRLADVEFLIADIDHTITTEHCTIPWFVVRDLERLSQARIRVLLVTGRSSGWSSALSVYLLGLDAIVCENGLIIARQGDLSILAGKELEKRASRQLDTNTKRVAEEFSLKTTNDSRFRILERTFERPTNFGIAKLARCNEIVSEDFEVIASSIHIHVRPRGWDKADGVRAALRAMLPDSPDPLGNIIVVGDSANDIPLFRSFANSSIGVANVADSIGELQGHLPRFVTEHSHAEGFHEIVTRILEAKGYGE
jgi:HAD superfamily hydrolase (TIGR01484 family)